MWTNKTCTKNQHIEILPVSQTLGFVKAVIWAQAWLLGFGLKRLLACSYGVHNQRQVSWETQSPRAVPWHWRGVYLDGSLLPLHSWQAASGIGLEEISLVAVVWLVLEPLLAKVKTTKSSGVLFQSELQGSPLSALSPWKIESQISQVLELFHSTFSQLVLKLGWEGLRELQLFSRYLSFIPGGGISS